MSSAQKSKTRSDVEMKTPAKRARIVCVRFVRTKAVIGLYFSF